MQNGLGLSNEDMSNVQRRYAVRHVIEIVVLMVCYFQKRRPVLDSGSQTTHTNADFRNQITRWKTIDEIHQINANSMNSYTSKTCVIIFDYTCMKPLHKFSTLLKSLRIELVRINLLLETVAEKYTFWCFS